MRKHIGSAELASLAAEAGIRYRKNRYGMHPIRYVSKRITVSGVTFKILGSGAFRVALLGPDGVVYKALMRIGSHDANHVDAEIRFFDKLEELGSVHCPDFCLYPDDVVAMPYYKEYLRVFGQYQQDPYAFHPEHWPFRDEMNSWTADVKPFNTGVTSDGVLVTIDGGCSIV